MKNIIRSLLVLLGITLCPVSADSSIEMNVSGGTMTMKQSYSGDKARNEIPQLSDSDSGLMVSGPVNPMSQPLMVTRLDKAVEWIIAKPSKTYMENPIKIPYLPMPPTAFSADNTQYSSNTNSPPEASGKMEVKKNGSQKIADFATDGYEIWMDGKLAAKYWIAAKDGVLKDAFGQKDAFEKKLNQLKYSTWPKDDQGAAVKSANAMQKAMFGQMTDSLKLFNTGLPDGIPLKVEFLDEDSGKLVTAMEVTMVNTNKIDAAQFEIPAGFTKTTQSAIAEDMMNMDPEAMQDMIQKAPENLNSDGVNPEQLLKLQKDIQQQKLQDQ